MRLFSLLLLLLVSCGDTPSGVKESNWSINVSVLSGYMPYISKIERCKWKQVLLNDNSGGLVPGPSRYGLVGVAVLSPDAASKLLADFKWTNINPDLKPIEGYDLNGSWSQSEGLMSKLPSLTVYRNGVFFFNSSERIVYFELAKD